MTKILYFTPGEQVRRSATERDAPVVDRMRPIPYACSMTKQRGLVSGSGVPVWLLFLVLAFSPLLEAQEGPRPAGFRDHQGVEVPVAFYYPASWMVVDQHDSVGIVSRPALVTEMADGAPSLEPGDAVLALGVMPAMFFEMMGAATDDLGSIMDALYGSVDAESGEIDEDDRRTHSFDAGDAVSVLFDVEGQAPSSLMIVARESEEVFSFGIAFGDREDLSAYREELAQVVTTVEFTGTMEDFYR